MPIVGIAVAIAPAVPLSGKLKTSPPEPVQLSVLVNVPATALLNDTVRFALPVAGTVSGFGATVNSGAAGAVQVTVAAVALGFWKLIVAAVAAPPSVNAGTVTVQTGTLSLNAGGTIAGSVGIGEFGAGG